MTNPKSLRKYLIFVLFTTAGSILQCSLLNSFELFGVKPDIFFIAVVIAGLTFDLFEAGLLGAFTGLLKDFFCSGTFGANILLYGVWGLVIFKISRKISVDNDLRKTVLLSLIIITNELARKIIYSCAGYSVPSGIFIKITVIETVYTAFVAAFLFGPMERILKSASLYKRI